VQNCILGVAIKYSFVCKKTIHGLDLGFLGAKKQFMV
jgi:hypothetical protein